MSKILALLLLFLTSSAFAALESVPVTSTFWNYGIYSDVDPLKTCVLLYQNSYAAPTYTIEVQEMSPPNPDAKYCMVYRASDHLYITGYSGISKSYVCPSVNYKQIGTPFRYNKTTAMCERINPCPHTYLGINVTQAMPYAVILGHREAVTTSYDTCDDFGCSATVLPSAASVLGISLQHVTLDATSCSDSVPRPPIQVSLAAANSAQTDYDALVAAQAASDGAAATAAAMRAASASAAAQANSDAAAASALSTLLAKAAAIKVKLPTPSAANGALDNSGITNASGQTSTTSATSITGGGGGGGSAGSGSGTAQQSGSCATFSICNVEQFLTDIKTAVGFGKTFDTASLDAQTANIKTDNKAALDKLITDADTAQIADEASVDGWFNLSIPTVSPQPFTGNVMGKTVTIDIGKYTEMLRDLFGWLWAIFGAYTIYGTIFRK